MALAAHPWALPFSSASLWEAAMPPISEERAARLTRNDSPKMRKRSPSPTDDLSFPGADPSVSDDPDPPGHPRRDGAFANRLQIDPRWVRAEVIRHLEDGHGNENSSSPCEARGHRSGITGSLDGGL